MRRLYGASKKGKLEIELGHPSTPPLTPQEMQAEMEALGVNISMASIRSAVEEWEMNNLLVNDDGRYSWKKKNESRF